MGMGLLAQRDRAFSAGGRGRAYARVSAAQHHRPQAALDDEARCAPDGSRLRVDDPELDAIWDVCGRLGVPVLIHTAEPQEFFEPIDYRNERWLELALYRDRRYPAGEFPRFEGCSPSGTACSASTPKRSFIAAHWDYHGTTMRSGSCTGWRCPIGAEEAVLQERARAVAWTAKQWLARIGRRWAVDGPQMARMAQIAGPQMARMAQIAGPQIAQKAQKAECR